MVWAMGGAAAGVVLTSHVLQVGRLPLSCKKVGVVVLPPTCVCASSRLIDIQYVLVGTGAGCCL